MRTKTIFSWIKFIKEINFGLLLLLLLGCYFVINTVFSIAYYELLVLGKEKTFFDCFYFSNITSFTIGYGDMFPTTILGKVFVIIHVILTYFLFALLIAILTTKLFYPRNTIIFSKNIFVDKKNKIIGFRILNIHSEPLINPEIRIHYTEHCVGNVIANIEHLVEPIQLGFLGKHDFISSIGVKDEFITNLENAISFDKNEQNKIKSRFRITVSITGNNGIQEIAQINRYYPKDFKEGTRFDAIQYNDSDKKNRIDYSKFGNFKEDFERIVQ